MWVLRTTTNNCRVIFIDFRIVPLPHTKTEILQDSYCGAMKEPGLPVVPVIVLTSFDATITSLCPHSKFLRWDLFVNLITNKETQVYTLPVPAESLLAPCSSLDLPEEQ